MHKQIVLPPLDQAQRYTVDEALAYLRMSRARLYEKIAAGDITVIKDGRRTYLPGSEIARVSGVPARAAA